MMAVSGRRIDVPRASKRRIIGSALSSRLPMRMPPGLQFLSVGDDLPRQLRAPITPSPLDRAADASAYCRRRAFWKDVLAVSSPLSSQL